MQLLCLFLLIVLNIILLIRNWFLNDELGCAKLDVKYWTNECNRKTETILSLRKKLEKIHEESK